MYGIEWNGDNLSGVVIDFFIFVLLLKLVYTFFHIFLDFLVKSPIFQVISGFIQSSFYPINKSSYSSYRPFGQGGDFNWEVRIN